jgi:hypothetical protein
MKERTYLVNFQKRRRGEERRGEPIRPYLVREENGGETVLLDRVVREELQTQAVPVGGDHLDSR